MEHISVERFQIPPREAKSIEIRLDCDNQLPNPLSRDYLHHLLTSISNRYEGRIIKLSDFLCFEFYGRTLNIEVHKVHVYPITGEIYEQMDNLSLNNEIFFHISSSTSWSILKDSNKNNIVYPIAHVGGLSDVYTKIMNIIQKTDHQSKSGVTKPKSLCVL